MTRQYGALSGIAVVLIIVNHAIHYALQVTPAEPLVLRALVVLQALGAYAVPIFLFVSGAFLAYAARELSLRLVRTNLERILWPYAVWSCIFYALVLVSTGSPSPAGTYLKNLLVGYPYHFVPLLVFWYVTAPVLAPIASRYGGLLLAAVAAYQVWLLGVRFPGIFGPSLTLPGWAHLTVPPVLFTPMSDWAIYFPLGLVLSLHGAALRPILLRCRALAVLASAVLFALGILNAFEFLWAPWARFAAPLPMMLVLPVVDRSAIPCVTSLEQLGRRSYGIYLVHFVVLNAIVLTGAGLLRSAPYAPVLLAAIFLGAALGVSLGLMEALGRFGAGRRVYRHLFGIVPPLSGSRPPGSLSPHRMTANIR